MKCVTAVSLAHLHLHRMFPEPGVNVHWVFTTVAKNGKYSNEICNENQPKTKHAIGRIFILTR